MTAKEYIQIKHAAMDWAEDKLRTERVTPMARMLVDALINEFITQLRVKGDQIDASEVNARMLGVLDSIWDETVPPFLTPAVSDMISTMEGISATQTTWRSLGVFSPKLMGRTKDIEEKAMKQVRDYVGVERVGPSNPHQYMSRSRAKEILSSYMEGSEKYGSFGYSLTREALRMNNYMDKEGERSATQWHIGENEDLQDALKNLLYYAHLNERGVTSKDLTFDQFIDSEITVYLRRKRMGNEDTGFVDASLMKTKDHMIPVKMKVRDVQGALGPRAGHRVLIKSRMNARGLMAVGAQVEAANTSGKYGPKHDGYTLSDEIMAEVEQFDEHTQATIREYLNPRYKKDSLNAKYNPKYDAWTYPSGPHERSVTQAMEIIQEARRRNRYGYQYKLIEGGFFDTFVQAAEIRDEIKRMTLQAITSKHISRKEYQDSILDYVEGRGMEPAFQRYFRTYAYDLYSKADRISNKVWAEELGLKHALYAGGLIRTSRDFCIERDGRYFTEKEIAKFGTPNDLYGGYADRATGHFHGKNDLYDPFIDCGGYNCRHSLTFISKEQYIKEIGATDIKGKIRAIGEQVENPEDFERMRNDLTRIVMEEALANEPQITRDLKVAANVQQVKQRAKLAGLKFRLKSYESAHEKVEREYIEKKNNWRAIYEEDLADLVRYTFIVNEQDYGSTVNRILTDMEVKGYKRVKVKNYWESKVYKGINTSLISPTNQRMEIQFHTQASFDTVHDINHKLYEESRLPTTTPERKTELEAQMEANWREVNVPATQIEVGSENYVEDFRWRFNVFDDWQEMIRQSVDGPADFWQGTSRTLEAQAQETLAIARRQIEQLLEVSVDPETTAAKDGTKPMAVVVDGFVESADDIERRVLKLAKFIEGKDGDSPPNLKSLREAIKLEDGYTIIRVAIGEDSVRETTGYLQRELMKLGYELVKTGHNVAMGVDMLQGFRQHYANKETKRRFKIEFYHPEAYDVYKEAGILENEIYELERRGQQWPDTAANIEKAVEDTLDFELGMLPSQVNRAMQVYVSFDPWITVTKATANKDRSRAHEVMTSKDMLELRNVYGKEGMTEAQMLDFLWDKLGSIWEGGASLHTKGWQKMSRYIFVRELLFAYKMFGIEGLRRAGHGMAFRAIGGINRVEKGMKAYGAVKLHGKFNKNRDGLEVSGHTYGLNSRMINNDPANERLQRVLGLYRDELRNAERKIVNVAEAIEAYRASLLTGEKVSLKHEVYLKEFMREVKVRKGVAQDATGLLVYTFPPTSDSIEVTAQLVDNYHKERLVELRERYEGHYRAKLRDIMNWGVSNIYQAREYGEGTIIHEMGHFMSTEAVHKMLAKAAKQKGISYAKLAQTSKEAHLHEDRWEELPRISRYGKTNLYEYLAELYLLWRLNPNAMNEPLYYMLNKYFPRADGIDHRFYDEDMYETLGMTEEERSLMERNGYDLSLIAHLNAENGDPAFVGEHVETNENTKWLVDTVYKWTRGSDNIRHLEEGDPRKVLLHYAVRARTKYETIYRGVSVRGKDTWDKWKNYLERNTGRVIQTDKTWGPSGWDARLMSGSVKKSVANDFGKGYGIRFTIIAQKGRMIRGLDIHSRIGNTYGHEHEVVFGDDYDLEIVSVHEHPNYRILDVVLRQIVDAPDAIPADDYRVRNYMEQWSSEVNVGA